MTAKRFVVRTLTFTTRTPSAVNPPHQVVDSVTNRTLDAFVSKRAAMAVARDLNHGIICQECGHGLIARVSGGTLCDACQAHQESE